MGASIASISQVIPILLTEPLALASVLPLPHVCDLGLDSYLNSLGTIRSWRLLPSITSKGDAVSICPESRDWPLTPAPSHWLSQASMVWVPDGLLKPEWTSGSLLPLLSTYHLLASWRGNFCRSPLGSLWGWTRYTFISPVKVIAGAAF